MFRMTYKEEGRERSIFDDTVIIFTSTNGALTPEVQLIGKPTKTWNNNPTYCRALEQEVAQTHPWEAAWATCWKGEPGFLHSSQIWTRFNEDCFLPVSSKLLLKQASGTMRSLFHIADWLPTIVQGVAGGQVCSSLSFHRQVNNISVSNSSDNFEFIKVNVIDHLHHPY